MAGILVELELEYGVRALERPICDVGNQSELVRRIGHNKVRAGVSLQPLYSGVA